MNSKSKFEIGQTLFLKSDLSGDNPMTVLEIDKYYCDSGCGYNVCWFTKSGRMLYNTFPENALREGVALK